MLDAVKDTQTTAETLLEVNNIEVIYNHVILVLKGVSLTVRKGGITALLGGNGAGKTTTLKAISNLLHSERGEVTKGTITYRGRHIAELTPVGPEPVAERALVGRHRAVGLVVMDGEGLESLGGPGLGDAAGLDNGLLELAALVGGEGGHGLLLLGWGLGFGGGFFGFDFFERLAVGCSLPRLRTAALGS